MEAIRCLITNNPVGTDTWQEDSPCECKNCLTWVEKARNIVLGKAVDETGLVYRIVPAELTKKLRAADRTELRKRQMQNIHNKATRY